MIKKIQADVNGIATSLCPHCGDIKKLNIETYKNKTEPVKIQCKCGNIYEVQIEFRIFYRKEARLEGRYSSLSNPGKWVKMKVRNLSYEGCSFETPAANMLHSGEEIKVEFILNDRKNSQIQEKAIVRYVRGHYVGCKFKKLPGAFDPDLGFYLR
jgi:hypothetical protein